MTSRGAVEVISLENVESGQPPITAARLWLHAETRWDLNLTALCPWCGTRFVVNDEWIGQEIDCPLDECGKPLKLNAFVCDTKDMVIKPDDPPALTKLADDFTAQRSAALLDYKAGDYSSAEQKLQELLASDFEVTGTRCHLARIALITNDLPSLREHTAEAWKVRAGAPGYVVPRILWLQLASALLDGDIVGVLHLLGYLKTALQDPKAIMEWSMNPVLDHLKPKLSASDHALLTALVDAMSFPDKLSTLDQFPLWRDAEPLSLE
jgi:hypothetical protein